MPYPKRHKHGKSSGTGTNSSLSWIDTPNIEKSVDTSLTQGSTIKNIERNYEKDVPPDYSNGLPIPQWIIDNNLSPTPPPGYQVKAWFPAAHCCPCCKTPTSDSQYKISCLYKHQIPCDGFHNTMMRPNKYNACTACNIELHTAEADEKRVFEAKKRALEQEDMSLSFSPKRKTPGAKVVRSASIAMKLKNEREDKLQNTLLRRLNRY